MSDWKLVPAEPTPEMWDAAWRSIGLPYRAKLSMHEIKTLFDAFCSAMLAAAPSPWIPCSERLPEPLQCVLAWTPDGMVPAVLDVGNDGGFWYRTPAFGRIDKIEDPDDLRANGVYGLSVTYWMPLPEPPKE